jgi:hypothetical protein
MSIDPVTAAFQAALDATDHVSLLLTAEQAGRGVDSSVAGNTAAVAICSAIGFPVANHNRHRVIFISLALTKLQELRFLCQGPSLAVPRGNYYAWHF